MRCATCIDNSNILVYDRVFSDAYVFSPQMIQVVSIIHRQKHDTWYM